MADIQDIFREELPPQSADRIADTPARYNASDAIIHNRTREPAPPQLKPFAPGVSGNPGGRPSNYTVTRALREALTVREAKRIADAAIELAADGSIRHMEYVRDSLEGKPGVRIADGEWNPETSPQFTVMQAFMQRVVGQPQTEQLPEPDATEADGEDS